MRIEEVILAAEEEIANLETSFAAPDFYENHSEDWKELEEQMAVGKKKVSDLYKRWEELEAIRTASELRS